MKEIDRMITMFAEGYSITAIADALHVDRKTVRQYVDQEDFSEPFPGTPQSASISVCKRNTEISLRARIRRSNGIFRNGGPHSPWPRRGH